MVAMPNLRSPAYTAQRNKTAKLDSVIIASFCQSHHPDAWQPATGEQKRLRSLMRHRDDLLLTQGQQQNRLRDATDELVKASLQTLTDDLLEMIPRHREAIMREYEARKQALPANGPVFPSDEGTWICPRNFTTHYKAVLRRAGLPESTRVHDLRHTMVTTALNNGQPLTVVNKYVGHSSVATTADIYGHRDETAERKVAESMGVILKKRKKKRQDDDAEPQ